MEITVLDQTDLNFDAEDTSMLGALYSRSLKSVKTHLEDVKKSGSSKFMSNYYVNYGHESIAEMGSTSVYLEGISVLAAKAIEDYCLFSGQESSTRYIDFSNNTLIDPVRNEDSAEILNGWINFYLENLPLVKEHFFKTIKKEADWDEKTYNKAIQAKAFDIMRGFLPCAITTNVCWHGNLRDFYQKLKLIKNHELPEVISLFKEIQEKLQVRYPNSFSHKVKKEHEDYLSKFTHKINYLHGNEGVLYPVNNLEIKYTLNVNKYLLLENELDILSERPKGVSLPNYLSKYGTYTFWFYLDFGSFRDLQRHRRGIIQIPIIEKSFGLNQWYSDQLSDEIQQKARTFLEVQEVRIKHLYNNNLMTKNEIQYFLPLGTNTKCEMTLSLPEIQYICELRSNQTVHPTLRKLVQKIHKIVMSNIPELNLYTNMEEDIFELKRGTQDIINKSEI